MQWPKGTFFSCDLIVQKPQDQKDFKGESGKAMFTRQASASSVVVVAKLVELKGQESRPHHITRGTLQPFFHFVFMLFSAIPKNISKE